MLAYLSPYLVQYELYFLSKVISKIYYIQQTWAALLYCQGHLQITLCRWPGDLFSRTLSGYHRETSTAGSECHTGMGDKEWLQVCSPDVQSHTFHYTTVSDSKTRPPPPPPPPPLWGLETQLCQWRSPQGSLGCGGTRTSHWRIGQRGTLVKAVHALLCENSFLHWQSGISYPAWIRPNH